MGPLREAFVTVDSLVIPAEKYRTQDCDVLGIFSSKLV
jgi:hypothetical protein